MRKWLIVALFVGMAGVLLAQDAADPMQNDPNCAPERLAQQQEAFMLALPFDFENAPERSRANLFRLAQFYQELAVQCGYVPNDQERNQLIQTTLNVADVPAILAASSVGNDVDAIMAELETVQGDSFSGQLLYNGLANGLDGVALGCSGCHNNAEAAPITEGTYTRVDEIRLAELEGYSVQQYLVESIVQPQAYIVPGYENQQMSGNYGTRLEIQMLADLIAFMNSQDQLIDDE